eukprot:m.526448 g.526448  ORF g.526448 m.526448 type:complete len:301 (+) comp57548_c1_seq4:139-1041(+)
MSSLNAKLRERELLDVTRPSLDASFISTASNDDVMTLNARAYGLRRKSEEESYISDVRKYLVELCAMFIMMVWGTAGSAQQYLGGQSLFNMHVNWGFSVAFAIYVSCAVSGGHLNPAVSIAFSLHRAFPWRLLPGYILVQFLGAFLACGLVYGVYYDAIKNFDAANPSLPFISGTASIFVPFPEPYVHDGNAFVDQVVGTALLLFGLFAIMDGRNVIPQSAQPAMMGLLLMCIALCLGLNCGNPVNPARDLGSRLFLVLVYGSDIFTAGDNFWWIAVLGPIVGAVIGATLYRVLINSHTT